MEARKALARVFDGATLEWRLGLADGETLSGRIHGPTLEEHQAGKTWTRDDIGLTWRVAEDTPDTHVMLPDEAAEWGVDLFDRGTGYRLGWDHPLDQVLAVQLAHFGLAGWELALAEPGYLDETDHEARFATCQRNVARVREALALDAA